MGERNEHALAVNAALSDDVAERRLAPEPFNGERPDQEDHARSHECELGIKP